MQSSLKTSLAEDFFVNESARLDRFQGLRSQARRLLLEWQLTPEIRFQVVANGDRERSEKESKLKLVCAVTESLIFVGLVAATSVCGFEAPRNEVGIKLRGVKVGS